MLIDRFNVHTRMYDTPHGAAQANIVVDHNKALFVLCRVGAINH